MNSLFISDLHLDDSRPQIVEQFQRFLKTEARSSDALYILGDLFESWIGDDDDSHLATQTATSLASLRASGVPIYFMHGNRDFLLADVYAQRSGMEILGDPTIVDLDGERVLLMHGDTLCVDDVDYQRFRQQVRDPDWQAQFLRQPLLARREFAARARVASSRHTSTAQADIMDVNQAAVEQALRTHQVTRMIHGHTHRPATHRFTLDGKPAERIVLGDWYEQSSVLTWPPPSADR